VYPGPVVIFPEVPLEFGIVGRVGCRPQLHAVGGQKKNQVASRHQDQGGATQLLKIVLLTNPLP